MGISDKLKNNKKEATKEPDDEATGGEGSNAEDSKDKFEKAADTIRGEDDEDDD